MTDNTKHGNTHSALSVTTSDSKSEDKQCQSAVTRLAHLLVLRLESAGLISKVLAAVSHLGVELLDHFAEGSDSDVEFDPDLSSEEEDQ